MTSFQWRSQIHSGYWGSISYSNGSFALCANGMPSHIDYATMKQIHKDLGKLLEEVDEEYDVD